MDRSVDLKDDIRGYCEKSVLWIVRKYERITKQISQKQQQQQKSNFLEIEKCAFLFVSFFPVANGNLIKYSTIF